VVEESDCVRSENAPMVESQDATKQSDDIKPQEEEEEVEEGEEDDDDEE
jgi:hypothetical protein